MATDLELAQVVRDAVLVLQQVEHRLLGLPSQVGDEGPRHAARTAGRALVRATDVEPDPLGLAEPPC